MALLSTETTNKIFSPLQIRERRNKAEILALMAEGYYFLHPEEWAYDALGMNLDPWQKETIHTLFTGKKRRMSVRAGHGCGKSMLAAVIAHTFLMNWIPSKIIVSGPCVEENEKILLADGRWVPIKELNGRYCGVLAVKDDLTFQPALAYVFPNGIKPVFRIRTRGGREALRTGNHPFRTLKGWTPLMNLRVGDYLAIPIELPAHGKQEINPEEVKFIAYMISEGCTSKIEYGHITFAQNPGLVLEDFRACVASFGCKIVTRERLHDIVGNVKTAGGRGINPLKEICRKYQLDGKRSWEKSVPPQIFELNDDLLRIFLSRLFAGDGYVRHKGLRELGYCSTSKELIHDVNRLLLRFGIKGRVRVRKREKITPGSLSRRDMYFWYVIGEDAVKFVNEIGLFGHEETANRIKTAELSRQRAALFDLLPPETRNEAIVALADKNIAHYSVGLPNNGKTINKETGKRIAKAIQSSYFDNISADHIAWDEIVEIEYIRDRMTYGMEVEGFHTYVTDFLEHNTGRQTRLQFWAYLNDIWNSSVFKNDLEWQKTKMFVRGEKNEENWFCAWVSSKNPKNMEGFHGPLEGRNLLWMIEEAKGVQDAAYEGLSGALSHEDNFLYISSTCGPPRGHFYKSHTTLRHIYDTMHVPSTMSPRVSKDQIETWKLQYNGEDSPIFRARVMAEFPTGSDFAIAPLEWLEDAIDSRSRFEESDAD